MQAAHPTRQEAALIVAGAKAGLAAALLQEEFPRLD